MLISIKFQFFKYFWHKFVLFLYLDVHSAVLVLIDSHLIVVDQDNEEDHKLLNFSDGPFMVIPVCVKLIGSKLLENFANMVNISDSTEVKCWSAKLFELFAVGRELPLVIIPQTSKQLLLDEVELFRIIVKS